MMKKLKRYSSVLIGCGRISSFHIVAIDKLPKMKLTAICDIDKEKAKGVGIKRNIPHYLDYEKMIKEIKPDIVHICTPSNLHLLMAIYCANMGCHIVCEKPMGLNEKEARIIYKTCKKNGVKLCCCFQNRFNSPIEKLKKEINKLGKIYNISLVVRWARDQKYYNDAWHGKIAKTGGGALTTQAIHHIDLLQYLVGMPVGVFAYKDTLKFTTEVEDIMVAVLKFNNGIKASLETSTLVYPHNLESSISIIAEKGTIKIAGVSMNKIEYWYTPDCTIKEKIEINSSESIYGLSHSKLFTNLIESIENNYDPLTNGKEGVKTAKIIDALYKSSNQGKEIIL